MNISKFFSTLIVGLVIIGFTTVGMASEESIYGEAKEATKSEAMTEEAGAAKDDSKVESEEGIQYGAKHELETDEKEAKAEEESE